MQYLNGKIQVMAGVTRTQMSVVVLIIGLVAGSTMFLTGNYPVSMACGFLAGLGAYLGFRWAFNNDPEKHKALQIEFDRGLDERGL